LVGLVGLVLLVTDIFPARSQAAGRNDWQEPDRVMEDLHLRSDAHVADVGCGTGYFTFRIAEAVKDNGKVLAVDVDERALDTLRNRSQKRGLDNIETIQSEATDTKLAAGSVDAALVCMVLHHVSKDDRQPLVKSTAEAVKPGGYLFVVDLRKVRNPPFHRYEELVSRDEVVELAEEAGLTLDAEWYYLPYQYFLRFRQAEKRPSSASGSD
jgi:ubiquinone/menaquinone biosynthesis C-methylase UbiE